MGGKDRYASAMVGGLIRYICIGLCLINVSYIMLIGSRFFFEQHFEASLLFGDTAILQKTSKTVRFYGVAPTSTKHFSRVHRNDHIPCLIFEGPVARPWTVSLAVQYRCACILHPDGSDASWWRAYSYTVVRHLSADRTSSWLSSALSAAPSRFWQSIWKYEKRISGAQQRHYDGRNYSCYSLISLYLSTDCLIWGNRDRRLVWFILNSNNRTWTPEELNLFLLSIEENVW
jgi:hypothetical protein